MLIKITNQCSAGCSHCMEDSTPRPDQHMTVEVFEKALNMTRRVEQMAWDMGCQPWILLSGGECTEHPQILDFIERTEWRGWSVLLIAEPEETLLVGEVPEIPQGAFPAEEALCLILRRVEAVLVAPMGLHERNLVGNRDEKQC